MMRLAAYLPDRALPATGARLVARNIAFMHSALAGFATGLGIHRHFASWHPGCFVARLCTILLHRRRGPA